MKQFCLILVAGIFSLSVSAQNNNGKKGKSKNNPSVSNSEVPGNSGGESQSDKSKDKSKEKFKDKEKDKSKGKEKDESKDKAKDKSKDKEKDESKNKEKDKEDKEKDKDDKSKNDDHDRKVWDGIDNGSGCGKISKNQPAKVRSSFQRDYPNATNVRWTKCRGDWTATFNGVAFRSTAVYHANGERRDTRTPVNQENIPTRVQDEIFKRRPVGSRIDDAIKIEVPNSGKEIYRIKNVSDGRIEYDYYDSNGLKVNYSY